MGRKIRKIKKIIRLFFKAILPQNFYNFIIYILIKNKFLNSLHKNKLKNYNYKNINGIKEYKISSQNYEDGIINSLISNLKKKIIFFLK